MGEKVDYERRRGVIRADSSRAHVGFQNEGVVKRLSMTHGKFKIHEKDSLLQKDEESKDDNKKLLRDHNLARFVDRNTNLVSQGRSSI